MGTMGAQTERKGDKSNISNFLTLSRFPGPFSVDCHRLNGLIPFSSPQWNQRHQNHDEAIRLIKEQVELVRNDVGSDHIRYVSILENLAAAYFQKGDLTQAAETHDKAIAILRARIDEVFNTQSERQQLLFAQEQRGLLFQDLTFAFELEGRAESAYENLLKWKGAVFDNQLSRREKVFSMESDKLVNQLRQAVSRLSTVMTALTYDRDLNPGDISTLNSMRLGYEDLQKALTLRIHTDSSTPNPSLAQIRDSLPNASALIDLQVYNHIIPSADQSSGFRLEARLLAFVIPKNGSMRLVQLGDVSPISKLSLEWRKEIVDSAVRKSTSPSRARQELRKLIWEPLESTLKGVKTVVICPDSEFCLLPFAALPGRTPHRYLLEDYAITTVPSARYLARLQTARPEQNEKRERSMLLIGEVDFSGQSVFKTPFGPLPGTAREIKEIEVLFQSLWRGSKLTIATGGAPTEDFFRRMANQHQYVHLATHGFFSTADRRPSERKIQQQLETFVEQYLEGLSSGVALGGANRPLPYPLTDPSADDGLLTSLEISSIDLRNVDLAVLSACETTSGQAPAGEGMLGLQRALQLAGARSTITSLWQVDDAATQVMMVEFYRNLWERKMSKLEALRQAQLSMLNRYDLGSQELKSDVKRQNSSNAGNTDRRLPPYYWASFVLSGDWN